jgi:hypothetical protein
VDDASRSAVVSRVYPAYPVAATADPPADAVIEEAVKVKDGEYRRTKNSYAQGGSCVSPTSPTRTSVIKADGSEGELSTAEYNCVGAVRWTAGQNGDRPRRVRPSGQGPQESAGDWANPTTEYVYTDPGRARAGSRDGRRPEGEHRRLVYESSYAFLDGLGRVFHTQSGWSSGRRGKVVARSTRFFRSSEAAENKRDRTSTGHDGSRRLRSSRLLRASNADRS